MRVRTTNLEIMSSCVTILTKTVKVRKVTMQTMMRSSTSAAPRWISSRRELGRS